MKCLSSSSSNSEWHFPFVIIIFCLVAKEVTSFLFALTEKWQMSKLKYLRKVLSYILLKPYIIKVQNKRWNGNLICILINLLKIRKNSVSTFICSDFRVCRSVSGWLVISQSLLPTYWVVLDSWPSKPTTAARTTLGTAPEPLLLQ